MQSHAAHGIIGNCSSLCLSFFQVARTRFSIVTGTAAAGLPFYISKLFASASGAAGIGMNESAGPDLVSARTDTAPTILEFLDKPVQNPWITSTKLMFASPFKRFKKGSFLSLKLEGDVPEKNPPRFLPATSPCMPGLCECIRKAAYDPRVKGLYIHVEPLSIGLARLQEIIDHIEFFRKSGKPTVAYLERGAQLEYLLACACEEVYVPPSSLIFLTGYCFASGHVRGVLDKLGIEPSVKKRGKYKTGDYLMRKDMSPEEKETFDALLDGFHAEFLSNVAKARGKTEKEVEALLNEGVFDMEQLVAGGWINAIKYPDELQEDLDKRFGNEKRKMPKKKPAASTTTTTTAVAGEGPQAALLVGTAREKPSKKLTYVEYKKYLKVSPSAFGLTGSKVVAVVRACGNIVPGTKEKEGNIRAQPLIDKLNKLAEDSSVVGVVLRVDSHGGDALASDMIWRAVRELAREKPLVATMGDVAASGGYYVSMGAPTVLAQPLTLTGSIGVVVPKFNAAGLFDKIGFSSTPLSRSKYAEIYNVSRKATAEEDQKVDDAVQHIYDGFRNKAALSRRMPEDTMEQHAQGRVWLGKDACTRGLIDQHGGVAKAVALVKQAANIPPHQQVTIKEVTATKFSPTMLFADGATTATMLQRLFWTVLANPFSLFTILQSSTLSSLLQAGSSSTTLADASPAEALNSHSHVMQMSPQLSVDPEILAAVGAATKGVGSGQSP